MSARVARRIAAGATALALAGLGLVGIGASAASAVDTIPADTPGFLGSFYLANGNDGTDYAPGTSLGWNDPTIGLLTPGDLVNPLPPAPAALGATGISDFIVPQGQEMDKTKWNAYADGMMQSTGQYLEPFMPYSLGIPGQGTPSGTAAVAIAGGDYTIGLAYTKNAGVTVVGWYGIHVHVTGNSNPDLATYTWQPIQVAMAPITTTITSAPATVQENTAFSLTATVSESGATGSVDFVADGTTDLGSAAVSGGTATLNVAAGLPAGSHSIVATYTGTDFTDASGSAPATINVTGQPQDTTTTVTATLHTGSTGVANDAVDYAATVVAANSTDPTGTVVFTASTDNFATSTLLGSAPLTAADHGSVTITKSSLGEGTWAIRATFTGTGVYNDSVSNPDASLTLAAPTVAPDDQTVTVNIPHGALTITTPYHATNPLSLGVAQFDAASSTWNASAPFGSAADGYITIVDNRPGDFGWTAKVISSDFALNGVATPSSNQKFSSEHAGLVDVAVDHATSPQLAAGVVTTDNAANVAGGLSSNKVFAQLGTGAAGSGAALGSTFLTGTFELSNVETSVLEGDYSATVTFTVQ